MTDERYTFIQDIREKKSVARSSHNRRTHCGKGGAVKMPSDYMSTKERNALNGEVKTWRMNEPMSWVEFRSMPRDLQKAYIETLRGKYNVPTTKLAAMFGIAQQTVSYRLRDLGLGPGRGAHGKFDSDGWELFLNGKAEPVSLTPDEAVPETEAGAILQAGSMTLTGDAASALAAVLPLMGKGKLKVTVSWEVL